MKRDPNYLKFVASCKEHVLRQKELGKLIVHYVYKYDVRKNEDVKWGLLIGYRYNTDDKVKFGWSLCNPKDPFNKYIGISKAFARLDNLPTDKDIKNENELEYLYDEYMFMKERAKRYFKDCNIPE